MGDKQKIYLYDPRTNLTKETTYEELSGITGQSKQSLMNYRSKRMKINKINCYILPTGMDKKSSLKLRYEWYAKETYPNEIWLPVEGSEGRAKISNYGRVMRIYKTKEKFAMPYLRKGYGNLFVKVMFLGKYAEHKVGQLVAHHFIRPRKKHEGVAHKNGIITDDHVDNLEYTCWFNLGKKTGHKSRSKTILMLDAETKEVINEFRSSRHAARNYPLSYQAILDRCHGKVPQTDGVMFVFGE